MSPPAPTSAVMPALELAPREHQLTIFERLEELARRASSIDPRRPAAGLFCVVAALMGLGLLIQSSHAATTSAPGAFLSELAGDAWLRFGALGLMLLAARAGPEGARRFVPALTVALAVVLVLCYVPPLAEPRNGSHRWVSLGPVSFQPSELARLVVVLWIADRCTILGPLVREGRRGALPMLALGFVFFALIAFETDLGGALLLLLCVLATMWVGGVRPGHVFGALLPLGASALALAFFCVPYVRRRIEMFLGQETSTQVADCLRAIDAGGLFGLGLGRGTARSGGVPYLESDFVFAQVGEELGLFGMALVLGLYAAFLWFGLQLVLSVRNRYAALASFGLLVSVALQAMLHVQVVAGLAPPKGLTLPFLSHGGTSLVVSSIAVGLALGAARGATPAPHPLVVHPRAVARVPVHPRAVARVPSFPSGAPARRASSHGL